jgi:hypothetical protein
MPRTALTNPSGLFGALGRAMSGGAPDAEDDHVLNPRRAPRLRLSCRCRVSTPERTWEAETEDVGPRGCQLVSKLPLPLGAPVQLVLSAPGGADLSVSGEVVWASPAEPFRAGVAFATRHAGATSRWFDDVVRTGAGYRAERWIRAIPARATVYLGAPPRFCPDFTPAEAAVVLAIGAGLPAGELRDRFAATWRETRHALFSLVARNLVTLSAQEAVPVGRWRSSQCHLATLAQEWRRREEADAAPPPASPEPARARPASAQALYEDAMVLVANGRTSSAIQALRSALALAPGDAVVAAALLRVACGPDRPEAPPPAVPAAPITRSG